MIIIIYPFGDFCPKCRRPELQGLLWCGGCDDLLEIEHLHKTCICTHRRIERCADAPADPTATAPPPAPDSEAEGAQP